MRNKMRDWATCAMGFICGVLITVICYEISNANTQTIELPIKGTVIETEVENVTDGTYLLEVYVKEAE